MGERQKGRNDLKLASLRRDREWVAKARDVAFELVDADPRLADTRSWPPRWRVPRRRRSRLPAQVVGTFR